MELRFHLSGSTLFSTTAEFAPTVGSTIIIETRAYKKGLTAGSIIEVPITENDPPQFDYTQGPEAVVHISLNGYQVLKNGPPPPE